MFLSKLVALKGCLSSMHIFSPILILPILFINLNLFLNFHPFIFNGLNLIFVHVENAILWIINCGLIYKFSLIEQLSILFFHLFVVHIPLTLNLYFFILKCIHIFHQFLSSTCFFVFFIGFVFSFLQFKDSSLDDILLIFSLF